VFDDTREHWVKNQTEETRVVLIIDFNADMPFPVNLYKPRWRYTSSGIRAR